MIARSPPRRVRGLGLALVAGHQPRQREGDVEGVLAVVVDGVDAVEAIDFAGEQPLEVGEGMQQGSVLDFRPGGAEELLDRRLAPLRVSSPARCW